jgi:hypothetical protein
MCIAKKAFAEVGDFSHSFDRTATTLRSSGELEFSKRLQRAGFRISFVASALVWHHIYDHRLRREYFLSRAYWQGRSDALLEVRWGRPAAFGPRDNGKNLTALLHAMGRLTVTGDDAYRFQRLLAFVREFGYCFQYGLLTCFPNILSGDLQTM